MMPRYSVRFTPDNGPNGDVVEFDAAMFQTAGEFVDFYSEARRNMAGYNNASGDIVRRIRADFVLEIVELTEK